MARPLQVSELIPELQEWIRKPTDPSLRKLLRKTVATLQAFTDLVGEPEPNSPDILSQAERIKNELT